MPGRQTHTVDLNEADFEQLIRIEGIDDKRAELILSYRREHGPFHSWDELRDVPGIGETLVERAREAATLGGEEAGEEGGAERGEEVAEQGAVAEAPAAQEMAEAEML